MVVETMSFERYTGRHEGKTEIGFPLCFMVRKLEGEVTLLSDGLIGWSMAY